MKNTLTTKIVNTSKIVGLALALSIGVGYVFAWTGPTVAPPNGNVAAPINVGTADQTKAGTLRAGGSFFANGNSYLQNTVYVTNRMAIFDGTPDAGLRLDVDGNIGAMRYCDEYGNNCTAPADIGRIKNVRLELTNCVWEKDQTFGENICSAPMSMKTGSRTDNTGAGTEHYRRCCQLQLSVNNP